MKPDFIGKELKGEQKILTIHEDHVTLKQIKNFRSFLTHDLLKGSKDIYFSTMTGIQFKPASSFILGFVQFETASTSGSNFGSENSWTFNKTQNELGESIAQYIRQKIGEARNGGTTVVQQVSAADELLKYKNLLDSGIITQEEFDAKKKELLGL